MLRITIACPRCNFSREIDESAIPPGATGGTCPKCRQKFMLSEAIKPLVPPATLSFPEPDLNAPPKLPLPFDPSEIHPKSHASEKPRPRNLGFSFTGTGRDYFGIWIVNTLLKILTIGIYSAWAKVRKRRYFYGNTFLNNAAFDYLAEPKVLFRGWIIAAAFFLLYSIGSKVSPVLSSILGGLFFIGMPWLIVRSRLFNLRNSEHRNIRFTFNPDYREAYVVFAGLPFLLPFTLGLIFPYIIYRQKKFFTENSGYGRTRCTFDAKVKEFYLIFLKATGWFIVLLVGFLAATYFLSATAREFSPLLLSGNATDMKTIQKGVVAMLIITLVGLNLIYLYFTVYVQTALANLTWNATRIKNSRFASTLRVRDMAWLYISSGVAILFSFGLLIPWASIRITRYRFGKLTLNLCDDMEGFLGWGHTGIGPAGEEIGDMFGIDIGL